MSTCPSRAVADAVWCGGSRTHTLSRPHYTPTLDRFFDSEKKGNVFIALTVLLVRILAPAAATHNHTTTPYCHSSHDCLGGGMPLCPLANTPNHHTVITPADG